MITILSVGIIGIICLVGCSSTEKASSVFAVAKITKIKKYIKALGGVKETVSLLIGATSIAEKGAAAGETLLKLAEILLGVDQVVDNCPGIKSTFNKLKQKFS